MGILLNFNFFLPPESGFFEKSQKNTSPVKELVSVLVYLFLRSQLAVNFPEAVLVFTPYSSPFTISGLLIITTAKDIEGV